MRKILIIPFLILACNFAALAQQDSLQNFRKQIDSLDVELIRVLGKRMEVVTAVGKYKALHQIAPLQSKRYEEIVKKNIQLGNQVQLSETFIKELMEAIHRESLTKENALRKL